MPTQHTDVAATELIPVCTFPIHSWAKKIYALLCARGWVQDNFTDADNRKAMVPAILSKLPPNMVGLVPSNFKRLGIRQL